MSARKDMYLYVYIYIYIRRESAFLFFVKQERWDVGGGEGGVERWAVSAI